MDFAPDASQVPAEVVARASHSRQVQDDPDPAMTLGHSRQPIAAFRWSPGLGGSWPAIRRAKRVGAIGRAEYG